MSISIFIKLKKYSKNRAYIKPDLNFIVIFYLISYYNVSFTHYFLQIQLNNYVLKDSDKTKPIYVNPTSIYSL